MKNRSTRMMGAVSALLFVVAGSGCSVEVEQILALQDGSELTIETTSPTSNSDVLPLTGGTVAVLDVSIGLFDLLFGRIDGDVDITELLIAAPGFDFFGNRFLNTQDICIIPATANIPPGSFDANLFSGTTTFELAIDTIATVGFEALAALLPGGGLPFSFELSSDLPLGFTDLLGLLLGGSSDLEITDVANAPIDIPIDLDGPDGPIAPFTVSGTITTDLRLASQDFFPTSPDLDLCLARLAE